MAFDLVSEPWLPCRARDGTRVTLGILALFERAHELECIDDPSPLITLALHRLLLAIVHRVVGPSSLAVWKALYTHGRLPTNELSAYLAEQRGGFDLLHPTRPFYQTRGLSNEYEPDGIGRLVLERSNYGAPSLLFQHRPIALAERDALPLAEAARNLVALHAFAPGGLVKKRGEPAAASAGPLNRGAYLLVRGASLFETLMFNLLIYDPENSRPLAGDATTDRPAWEQPPVARPVGGLEPRRLPYGYLDWLTWQSRRVELVESPDRHAIAGIVYCVAQGIGDPHPRDPMLAFRVHPQRGPIPIDLSEARAVWRDCHAFVREGGQDGAAPPAAVAQLGTRELRGVLTDTRPSLQVLGLRGDQAKLHVSRAERLAVPGAILAEPDLQARLADASGAAEAVGVALRAALRIAAARSLSPGQREPHKDDVTNLVESIGGERAYWAALATPFGLFLDELPRDPDSAGKAFISAVRVIARQALRSACCGLGSEARYLKALACAEGYLLREFANSPAENAVS